MRESSKYLLGGLGVLIAQTLFIALFGSPQRMNHPSPAAIGLFAAAFVCIGYGAFLRWAEASSRTPASLWKTGSADHIAPDNRLSSEKSGTPFHSFPDDD